jgi:hypothetical protein
MGDASQSIWVKRSQPGRKAIEESAPGQASSDGDPDASLAFSNLPSDRLSDHALCAQALVNKFEFLDLFFFT